MPKIEPGDERHFLIDGVPYQRGGYEIDPNADKTRVGIRVRGTENRYLESQQLVTNWTDASNAVIPDFNSFVTYLTSFFFRNSAGGGSNLTLSQINNENSTDYGSINGQILQQALSQSVNTPDLRLVLSESFVGDGSTTTFNLTGSLNNGSFTSGSWSSTNILPSLPSHIVRSDNKKPTYDTIPNFLGNRVSVVSISSGVVTLSHPPRSGINFDVFYWYDTQDGDVIEDYQRIDFVASMEADNSRIDAKIDTKVDKEFLGWVQITDTQYTQASPFTILSNVRTKLPNNSGSILNLVNMFAGVTIYNPVTGKLEPDNSGDTYDWRVQFFADPSINNRNLTLELDIGGTQGVIWSKTIRLARGAGVDTKITETLDIYTLGTFIANGGELFVICDGDVNIYEIVYKIERKYRA